MDASYVEQQRLRQGRAAADERVRAARKQEAAKEEAEVRRWRVYQHS